MATLRGEQDLAGAHQPPGLMAPYVGVWLMDALLPVLIDCAGIAAVILLVIFLRERRKTLVLLMGTLPLMLLVVPASISPQVPEESGKNRTHIQAPEASLALLASKPRGSESKASVAAPVVAVPPSVSGSQAAIAAAHHLISSAHKVTVEAGPHVALRHSRQTPDGIHRTSAITSEQFDAAPVSVVEPGTVGKVVVDVGNVRSGPGLDNSIIGKVHLGDELVFLDRRGDWFLVQLSRKVTKASAIQDTEGWVSRILLETPPVPALQTLRQAASFEWQTPSDSTFIFERDGLLHLRVTQEQAGNEQSGNAVHASVAAGTTGAPVQEISFLMTLEWSQGHAPGGSIFHVVLGDGRELAMRVGPGEGFPWIDFILDDQEINGPGTGFPLRTPTPIRLAWNQREVTVRVGDEQRVSVPVDQPIESFRFTIDTEKGCIFHITVGDMSVEYVD
jgi:hypothetical protein